MKRYTLAIAIFLVGIGLLGAANVQAQNTDNVSATVSTSVIQDITITKDQDLSFGEVFQGSTPQMDPTQSGGNTDVGSGAQLGDFTVSGGNGVPITVTLSSTSLVLGNGDGSTTDDPTYTAWLAGSQSDDFSNTTEIYNSSGTDQNPSINLNSSGNYFLFLGGSLGTISTDASGNYSNTLTVTASYN